MCVLKKTLLFVWLTYISWTQTGVGLLEFSWCRIRIGFGFKICKTGLDRTQENQRPNTSNRRQKGGPAGCTKRRSGWLRKWVGRVAEKGSPPTRPFPQPSLLCSPPAEMITIRFAGWISGRIVSLQPDTDIQKLLSYGSRIRFRISETFLSIFRGFRFFEKVAHCTIIHYLQKHLFSSLLCPGPSPGFSCRGGQKPEGRAKNQKGGPHF